MTKASEYLRNLIELTETILDTQQDKIDLAARACAKALENGKKINAFGTGHSHILSEEIFYRAGGLVKVNPVLIPELMLHESASGSTVKERETGLADSICKEWGFEEGDVLFLFSNSGRNGAAIDLAMKAEELGLTRIIITNMKHTASGKSRHPSGKKLCDMGDIVIDNCGCVGDACMEIEGFPRNVAPTSTSAGAAILNAIVAQCTDIMVRDGFEPEVFASSNVDGGDDINNLFTEKYKGVIKSL